MESARYDVIGATYASTRREDPRIAAMLWNELAGASSVANIGAGTGNYEPRDRQVVAVEPSSVMLGQRPAGAAQAVQGVAEDIPLEDDGVDAAMAIFSDHHWTDCERGLAEMQRVARQRVVALTVDHRLDSRFWLIRDYLTAYRPLLDRKHVNLFELATRERATAIKPVPVPYDCLDGFFRAFWHRPEAYLDSRVRAGISVFHRLEPTHIEEAIGRLADDVSDGSWYERNRELLELDELDLGLRLIVWDLQAPG